MVFEAPLLSLYKEVLDVALDMLVPLLFLVITPLSQIGLAQLSMLQPDDSSFIVEQR